MSFDTSMSAARAMAADEPGRPDGVRAPVFEQVAARLQQLRTDGRHEFTMRLDPADLGGVTIDARLEGTRLTVHIRAEHGATQELLNDTLPRLREALSQQGFAPDQLSVQLGLDGSGGSGGGAARDGARSFTAPTLPGFPAPAPLRTPRGSVPTTVSGARGGLDVWA
jgi:flagellar hook-length control protein FliK